MAEQAVVDDFPFFITVTFGRTDFVGPFKHFYHQKAKLFDVTNCNFKDKVFKTDKKYEIPSQIQWQQ